VTKDDFLQLSQGDIVQNMSPDSKPIMVTSNYGDRVTAVATYDLTNPSEWEIILKANYTKGTNQ